MVPLVVYTVATLILTYPVIAQLDSHLAAMVNSDGFEPVRMIWWTREAISQGLHPAYQPLLVYPQGFFEPAHWAAPLSHVAGLPFLLLFAPLVAYNLTFLSTWVFTGWAAFWFLRELTHHDGAALLGGLVFMAWPLRQTQAAAGHLPLITHYWLALYAWSLIRFWRKPGDRSALMAGVCFVLAAGTAVTNLAYELVPLTAVYSLLMFWRQQESLRRVLRPVLVFGGVALAGILVLFLPLAMDLASGQPDNLQAAGTVDFSTDLLGFITSSPFNDHMRALGLVPGWADDVLVQNNNLIEEMAYLGLVPVALAGVALWQQRKDAVPWLMVALGAMVLALGPVLKVNGQPVTVGENGQTIALPYAVYSALPGLNLGRTPGRINQVTGLAVATLAALGFSAASERWPVLSRPPTSWGLVAGLTAVILFEYQVFTPFPTTAAPMPAYLGELAADANQGDVRPVVDLPANDFLVTVWELYYQTGHHQPLVAGHVIRQTPANHAMLRLVDMAALPPETNGLVPTLTADQQAAIYRAARAEVVIVHRDRRPGPEMAAHLVTVLGEPVYDDERVTIFEVPDGPLPEAPLFALDGRWEADGQPDSWWLDRAAVDGWWLAQVGDGILEALPPDMPDGWTWEMSPSLVDRWLRVVFGTDYAAHRDTPPGPSDDGIVWRFAAYLPESGFRYVRFWIDEDVAGCALLPGADICRRALGGGPLTADQAAVATLYVDFGSGAMRLLSASARVAGAEVYAVNVTWQALGEMRADYTMFVHLLNEVGESVAQWDGPIGGDNLRTSHWMVGEVQVQDAILPLPEDLPPGTYQVYVGLYAYPDLTRLTVGSDLPRAADGLLWIDTLVLTGTGG